MNDEHDRRRLRRRRQAVALVSAAIAAVAVAVVLTQPYGKTPRPHPIVSTPTPTTSTTTTTTTAASLAPAQPAPSSEAFGVNVNRLFNDGTYSSRQIGVQLTALHRTGATLARSDAFWEASEAHPPIRGVHQFDWSFDDTVAGSLAVHDLAWLPIIDYSAAWDESLPGQDHSPPASTLDYAAYAGAFAARYGSRGTFWREHPQLPAKPVGTYEIWNEPDSGLFWAPTPNAARYADLYLAARAAITTVDPRARVIIGGLTLPGQFLPALLAARPQLAEHIDGIAVHPYGLPSAILAKVRADRQTLVSLGLPRVPLYITEFGWATSPAGGLNYVPAARRPQYIRKTFTALGHLNCGLAAAIIYTWVTPQRNPANNEDWYGIHSPDGGATADTAALTAGLLGARAPHTPIDLCGSR